MVDVRERSAAPAEVPDEGRRRFFAALLGSAGAAVAVETLLPAPALAEDGVVASVQPEPIAFVDGSQLERMRADIERALQKPLDQRRWGMVIDLQKCIGCKACTVSCEAENVLPPGVTYRPVMIEELGTFPNVRNRFLPRPCMQCDDPPCVPPCPVGATFKRDDGVVEIDYDTCIGCRYCITACPYGARSFDFSEFYTEDTPHLMPWETRPNYEYGEEWVRDPDHPNRSPMGNARKCHFCLHRVEVGLLPACVTTCLGGATYFGDLNDPDSLVSELVASERVMRLKEELGTNPKVYYLV